LHIEAMGAPLTLLLPGSAHEIKPLEKIFSFFYPFGTFWPGGKDARPAEFGIAVAEERGFFFSFY